jgi:hypothetical protein
MRWHIETDLERPGMLQWERQQGLTWYGIRSAKNILIEALEGWLYSPSVAELELHQ